MHALRNPAGGPRPGTFRMERELHQQTFMKVRELMTHPAITCHVNDPLNMAAHRMWDQDCGALPVINDDGRVTGMITDRDICMAAYTQGRSLDAMLVNSAMATHVVSCHPEQTILEVEQLMSVHQVRRLPVVDAEGKPLGVISIDDLAKESARPNSRMKQGMAAVTHTLAAICGPRNGRGATTDAP